MVQGQWLFQRMGIYIFYGLTYFHFYTTLSLKTPPVESEGILLPAMAALGFNPLCCILCGGLICREFQNYPQWMHKFRASKLPATVTTIATIRLAYYTQSTPSTMPATRRVSLLWGSDAKVTIPCGPSAAPGFGGREMIRLWKAAVVQAMMGVLVAI